MRFSPLTASVLAIASLATGCSHASGLPRPREATTRASSTVITTAEIARVGLRGTVQDAVERIRPTWLLSRGAAPLVSIDGTAVGDLSTLRMIPLAEVLEVRLDRSSSSLTRGQSHRTATWSWAT